MLHGLCWDRYRTLRVVCMSSVFRWCLPAYVSWENTRDGKKNDRRGLRLLLSLPVLSSAGCLWLFRWLVVGGWCPD